MTDVLIIRPENDDVEKTAEDIVTDLRDIESLFRDGSMSTHVDAAMIWMGAHINWRGLELI